MALVSSSIDGLLSIKPFSYFFFSCWWIYVILRLRVLALVLSTSHPLKFKSSLFKQSTKTHLTLHDKDNFDSFLKYFRNQLPTITILSILDLLIKEAQQTSQLNSPKNKLELWVQYVSSTSRVV